MIDKEKIKSLRLSRGLSLAQASCLAGWGEQGRTRWHDVEAGRRKSVTIKTLEQIAFALGCSPRSILKADGDAA